MSKVTPNKPFPVTWPQSGVTFFLTCRARSRKCRTAFALKWPLQSSNPVAATNVQSNPEQAVSRVCNEVALAELETSSSQPSMSKVTPNKPFPVTWPQSGVTLFLTCRARSRNGRTAVAMKWPCRAPNQ